MALPRALLVLKDGHVGSEWFAETVARQPGTRFLFEMGPCITGSLATKAAFFSSARRACACTKEDCALFRAEMATAPCLGAPSRTSCHVLGGSHISVTSELELEQWKQVLRNHTSAMLLVQSRSNLVKWAWSFYRTGAMRRLRRAPTTDAAAAAAAATTLPRGSDGFASGSGGGGMALPMVAASHVPPSPQVRHRRPARERIHLRYATNRTRLVPVRVDPKALLRMVIAKQTRSVRLVETARRFARLTSQRRERVLLYEAMQADLQGELQRLYAAMRVPFDVVAHQQVPEGALLKHAPEELSLAMANWEEVRRAFARFPCLHAMLVDKRRRIFDDCGFDGGTDGSGNAIVVGSDPTAPCVCSWRTPIQDPHTGEVLDDAAAKALSWL